MRSDRHKEAQTSFPSGATEPMQTSLENTYSFAAEHECHLTPALSLTMGAGYDWRDLKRAEEYGAPLGTSGASVLYNYPMRNSSAWSGQGRLDWAATEATRLHISLSPRAAAFPPSLNASASALARLSPTRRWPRNVRARSSLADRRNWARSALKARPSTRL
jgi:outer membrane receptor protein involved in Fe transport